MQHRLAVGTSYASSPPHPCVHIGTPSPAMRLPQAKLSVLDGRADALQIATIKCNTPQRLPAQILGTGAAPMLRTTTTSSSAPPPLNAAPSHYIPSYLIALLPAAHLRLKPVTSSYTRTRETPSPPHPVARSTVATPTRCTSTLNDPTLAATALGPT